MRFYANALVNGGKDYRQEALRSFENRLSKLRALVSFLTDNPPASVDVLLLPAGYFCAATVARAERLGNEVAAVLAASRPPFMVVWGVDGWTPHGKQELKRGASGYPFFAFALPGGQSEPLPFRQLSIYAWENELADTMWGERLSCCSEGNALLVCGESWSDALLGRVEAAHPAALLIPAHWNVNLRRDKVGMGRMSWHHRLDRFSSRTGIPVILSDHTRSPSRHDYAWGAKVVQVVGLPKDLKNLFTLKLVGVDGMDRGGERVSEIAKKLS
jgi:hypothetical protein